MTFRPLKAFAVRGGITPSREIGRTATLAHLPLDRLVVDESYQRSITPQGRSNIVRIAESFDWRMFSPLIVVAVEDGRWAIIDGQHRATAALMHGGIATVPCMVIEASRAEAAACFAAINGAVTAMQKGQMWHARVAAGEHFACAVAAACAESGVTILKHKASEQAYQIGATMAVGAIEGIAKAHGAGVLVVTLSAITMSRDGNPGQLRADAIKAVAANVIEHRSDRARAIAAMQAVDLVAGTGEASGRSLTDRRPVNVHLREIIAPHFASQPKPQARFQVGPARQLEDA